MKIINLVEKIHLNQFPVIYDHIHKEACSLLTYIYFHSENTSCNMPSTIDHFNVWLRLIIRCLTRPFVNTIMQLSAYLSLSLRKILELPCHVTMYCLLSFDSPCPPLLLTLFKSRTVGIGEDELSGQHSRLEDDIPYCCYWK